MSASLPSDTFAPSSQRIRDLKPSLTRSSMKGSMSDPNCGRNAAGRTIRNVVKSGPSATTFVIFDELRKSCSLPANAARTSALDCSPSKAAAVTEVLTKARYTSKAAIKDIEVLGTLGPRLAGDRTDLARRGAPDRKRRQRAHGNRNRERDRVAAGPVVEQPGHPGTGGAACQRHEHDAAKDAAVMRALKNLQHHRAHDRGEAVAKRTLREHHEIDQQQARLIFQSDQ